MKIIFFTEKRIPEIWRVRIGKCRWEIFKLHIYPPHLENPQPQNELTELDEDDEDDDLNDDPHDELL